MAWSSRISNGGDVPRQFDFYAQVGAEAAPPYSTFTVLLLLSGKEVGAAASALPLRATAAAGALPLRAAAAAGLMSARQQRAAKSMAPSARRIDGYAGCVHARLHCEL